MKNKIAAIQMTSSNDVNTNLKEAEKLITLSVNKGAELIVLPEMFAIIGKTDQEKLKIAEQEGSGVIQNFLANQAANHKIWIVGGTIPLTSGIPGKVSASCLVYNEKGNQVARYDKIHLFDVLVGKETYHESSTVAAGDKVIVVPTPFGNLGLCVCYDIRFPELVQRLVENGAEIIAVPTAFTAITGAAHWEILIRALAIQSQCFVVGSCQQGVHPNGRKTHGDSLIIDPWGVVLSRLPTGSGVVVAEINLQHLREIREKMPLQKYRGRNYLHS